jgi:anti-sigma regulatory factor (Ser/Thr protein kinase)
MTAATVRVADPSGAGEARRMVARLALRMGFGETEAGRAAIVATELAGNLAKHTPSGGSFLAQPVERGGQPGLQMVALDQGPGMANVAMCLRDGYSTAGSPGTGLGAVQRQADAFDIHSSPGVGTAIVARVWSAPADEAPRTGAAYGVVSVPKPGQDACGDGWAVAGVPGAERVLVVDGLGHGPDAARVAVEAARVFRLHAAGQPAEILERMHQALRSTRGGAAAVLAIDGAAGELRFAGVGNISASVSVGAESRSMMSHNGIVGHEMRKVQEISYPCPPGALLILHSDGITSRWALERYPGLTARDPAVLAAILLRDALRGTDDATVLALRAGRPA